MQIRGLIKLAACIICSKETIIILENIRYVICLRSLQILLTDSIQSVKIPLQALRTCSGDQDD